MLAIVLMMTLGVLVAGAVAVYVAYPHRGEELRENSQLLVITHQKRTMEVGDALYGVTMRGDGVSAVISQRLRDAESA